MGFPAEGFSIFMVKVPAVSFRNYPSLLCFSALSQTIWTRSRWSGGWEKSDLVSSTPYFYISTQEQGNWVRIFSIAIDRRVHFKQIRIPGLKQNDILSLSLSLSLLLCLPLLSFLLFFLSVMLYSLYLVPYYEMWDMGDSIQLHHFNIFYLLMNIDQDKFSHLDN